MRRPPPLGCEPVVGSLEPSNTKQYRAVNRIQEGKRPTYAIAFNFLDARYFDVFATAGGNQVTVYQCKEGGSIATLQTYVDKGKDECFLPKKKKDECFYTLSWACSLDGSPFVVAAGKHGVIRVINAGNEKIHKSLVGHGGPINEIRTQTLKSSLVASASKDESLRLWNVQTGICILIFSGGGGHRNEVLSVDFHPSDMYQIITGGMDNTIKIWSIKELWKYVEKSYTWTDLPSKFPTKYVQAPLFISSIHNNYVDCCRWMGDYILSKSVDNEIVLWDPIIEEQVFEEGSLDTLQIYPIPKCDVWFIKFSFDFHFKEAAIGNSTGEIFVWEVQSCPPVLIQKLSHKHCNSIIRQTSVSLDGSTILAACEDGTIWRWDVKL